MNIKLIKDIEIGNIIYQSGKNLMVTNNYGRQLIAENKAIEVGTLKAITTKTKKKKINW
jgi:hypothetical protein